MAEKVNPHEVIEALTAKLTDEGRIIEAGWVAMRALAIPEDAPQIQLDEMRNAFFAGAQHLFASIMVVLDPGDEPTEQDLNRFDQIDAELKRFISEYSARAAKSEGST